jgi:hypothetical protein
MYKLGLHAELLNNGLGGTLFGVDT